MFKKLKFCNTLAAPPSIENTETLLQLSANFFLQGVEYRDFFNMKFTIKNALLNSIY